MPDRPLILFPSPERADREHKPPVFTKTSIPSYGRQFTRLQPSFNVLNSAFTQKSLKVQLSIRTFFFLKKERTKEKRKAVQQLHLQKMAYQI